MIYSSVSGAVVAALAAGEKGSAKAQAWQKLYKSAEEEGGCLASLGRRSGGIDRTQIDYWLSARLHHMLKGRHWDALVAKYSTNKAKKVQAITLIRPLIASPAPTLFIYKAVTAWAIPKLKGARRKAPQSVSVDIPLDASPWRREVAVNAAVAAGQAAKKRIEAVEEDVIILPNSFYDMNTWDLDATPEPTRRRWRQGISEKLDGMIDDALTEVRVILEAEGLLIKEAA
ncbi:MULTISPECIES: hypothetical protein [unclassified Pseudomonas]|uniref:hypothetical protein n=1 Tax=unclassified Pseudomonas TaxID=196821 RepID=UPI000A0A422E|nr:MULTISPECIES: hypothetical protein [unclassified Pseudomonas]SMF36812.1 hypothetical protein SAMN02745962_03318 [Pseudomonas sp. LAIL14HWK12:I11]SMR78977.1 hypothetical protein SAMN05661028_03783 [Pseudomonas sp. LAIL14HWK12:I10]SOD04735.1 hypothetical protein SAMN05660296_03332 [Pseudomonas sp. LAIL14HWK12:I8]